MSLNERILADLRRTYISAVQEMALSPEGSNGHRRREILAASTSHTVFSIFGGKEAEKLRKEGLREFARIRGAALGAARFTVALARGASTLSRKSG